ncbi:MAG: S41 family peptidase [Bacteroidales bacterium]|nr:S41 family peptidase [Bacteroidales bacterium]
MKQTAFLLILIFSFSACHEDVNESTDPQNIFETLWSILDEKYCFFDAKGVDWDQVHDEYAFRVDTCKNSDSLLKVLGEMICILQDGHVNLYTAHDLIRYWKWFEDYDPNFDESLQRSYLGTNYQIASGLKYKIIGGNVGYITYNSFSSAVSDAGLDYIFKYFDNCRGIIIDVRDNSGGDLSNVNKLACRFTEKKFICGYIRHKTGPGHNDFSEPYPIYLEPYEGKRYTKKVVILTNRMCYSATNTFVTVMRQLPNVIIMGDRTGGGGGFPISSMLPNGWSVRFSSCPTYDEKYKLTEEGIEPDSTVYLTKRDIQREVDVIIETAYSLLQKI